MSEPKYRPKIDELGQSALTYANTLPTKLAGVENTDFVCYEATTTYKGGTKNEQICR